MLDPELRPRYLPAKLAAAVLGRAWAARLLLGASRRFLRGKDVPGLRCEERQVQSHEAGREIRVRVYRPREAAGPLPGMLYLHGGGYMVGQPEEYGELIRGFIEASPCVVVAPDYRKSLEAPYPAAFDDCYDTLRWLHRHAAELGVRPGKLVVAGHSAGGGLTAAVALKATDTGEVPIAFQLPIYPMLDDRQETPSATDNDAPLWDSRANRLGWGLYLKGLAEVPPYAAAARATDLSRLPPTITFVGELEPFRDETVAYVERLRQAGVPVTFELFPGAFHGFEILAPDSALGRRATAFLLGRYREFMARYVEGTG